ncbi:MAG: DUF6600 domain-containing protein [Polyangiaceae bacterium]
MTKLMRRWRAAGLAAVLMSGLAIGARADENEPPAERKAPPPQPPRTTSKTITSTEIGGTVTVPSGPAAPTVPTAELPALPTASPPADPAPATVPSSPSEADPATASSEPPTPSEYDQAADMDPAALNDFRDTLSPYGAWEDDATYGVVWVPNSGVVGADFAPYVSHGHWGLTATNSWLWVSDFSWGWAPFHYGRWVWIGGRGWSWIPGRVYAPAWDVWRTWYYDDYYVGWAPMPPSWYWRRGWAYRLGFAPPASYVFCSASYVFSPRVRTYIAPPARVNLIAPRTRPYVAANPSVVSPGHTAITMTRGPSMNDAHVPQGSIPAERVSPDARAVSYARMHPQTRSIGTDGTFAGRGGVMPRSPGFPSAPGSSVYTTRPGMPAGASMPQTYGPRPLPPGSNMPGSNMPGPQVYSPRPMAPGGQYEPPLPNVPRPAPIAPSSPRFEGPSPAGPPPYRPPAYSPPSTSFSRPSMSPPVMRPSSPTPSPAPAIRPSAPSVSRPSAPSAPAMRPSSPSIRSAPRPSR